MYHVLGKKLIKHKDCGERAVALLDTESKDGPKYIIETFTVLTSNG